MKHLLLTSVAGAGLLFGGLAANAQTMNRVQYRYGYGQEQYQERGERGEWFFNRLRSDLDQAQATATPYSGDRWRIQRAREEVNELQQSWENGNRDPRAMDDAIRSVQRVMSNNRLNDRERDYLASDLQRMRDFRARMDYGR